MTKKFIIGSALILALVLIVGPGCSDDKKTEAPATSVSGSLVTPPEGGATAPAPPQAPAAPSPEVLQAKWNTYAQITNLVNGQLEPLLRIYHQAFGESQFFLQPTSKEALEAFNNATLGSREAIELIERAEQISAALPQSELDRVAAVSMPVMKYLWLVMAEMGTYMRSQEYENDSYARADALHSLVLEGTEALNQSLPVFLGMVIEQDSAFRNQAATNMRAKGLPVMAGMMDFVNTAKALQDFFLRRGVTGAEAFGQIPVEELAPFCERLTESFKTLDEAAGQKELVEKEGLHAFSVDEYRQLAKSLQGQAAAFLDQRKKKRAPAAQAFDKFNQDISRLIRRYNGFVQANAG